MSETPPEEEPVDYEAVAFSIVRELLGRRLTWPAIRVIDEYPVNRELILSGRPVREVLSVKVVTANGERLLDPSTYRHDSKFRIRIDGFVPLPVPTYFNGRCRTTVHVEYVYGSPPPPALADAIKYYGEQLQLGAEGSSECKLPKRVTSIARQGISMTILDPQDFLDKGRTGLPEVDTVISVYNPGKAKARARLFTEKNPPARRLLAETYNN